MIDFRNTLKDVESGYVDPTGVAASFPVSNVNKYRFVHKVDYSRVVSQVNYNRFVSKFSYDRSVVETFTVHPADIRIVKPTVLITVGCTGVPRS